MSAWRRPAPAFLLAWVLFLLAALAPWALASLIPAWPGALWVEHAVTKTLLLVFALLAMAFSGGKPADWGFRAPVDPHWKLTVLRGASLGAVASALLILTPAEGLAWIAGLGLPKLILWIWLYSSVTEEIFVRGWFQPFVLLRPDAARSAAESRLSRRVVLSGVFFGSLHLTMLARGTDIWTTAILVTATTLLGLRAAADRERTRSIAPPIVTHVAFNVGGFVGAVAVATAVYAVTGRPPVP